MGWDYQHVTQPINRVELIKKEYTWETETKRYTPIKGVCVNQVVYLAVEETNKQSEEKNVFAIVAPTRVTRDYFNFGFKSISEDCGPYFYDCPASILDLLTPTTSDYANKWREECRQQYQKKIDQKKGAINLSKCELGTKIVIKHPLTNEDIVLEKYQPFKRKRAIWLDKERNTFYPMTRIYEIGFRSFVE